MSDCLHRVPFHKLRKIHSQNYDEDLILHEILRKLQIKSGISVELMGGNGIECNTSRLAISGKWKSIIFDGNDNLIREGLAFYQEFPKGYQPTLVNAWITKENIYNLLQLHCGIDSTGQLNEIDVLSLDMDGMDFWIMKSLYQKAIKPKILILEIQEMWTDQTSLCLEYQHDFNTNRPEESGCSLRAFLILLEKDYRLVACIQKGFNVFLIRRDLDPLAQRFDDFDPKMCFSHHANPYIENIMQWRRNKVEQNEGVGKWINPHGN